MKSTALALAQTPPLSVPMRYFITAPLFAVAAGGVLLVYGPTVFVSRWTTSLLTVTHFITLGFLTMAMMGAMQQLLPVVAGVLPLRPRLVSTMVHALLCLGTVLLGIGWLFGAGLSLYGAMLVLGIGSLIFISVMFYSLMQSPSASATVTGMVLAVIALAVTVVLGVYLISTHIWGYSALPYRLTDMHMTWGLVGWVGLLVAGIAYQVVPMFQITPDYPDPLTHWYSRGLFLLLTVWSMTIPLILDNPGYKDLAGGLMVVSMFIFAITTLVLQHRRRRKLPDVTLNFWRLAMVNILLAGLLWAVNLVVEYAVLPVLFTVLYIYGFAVSVVTGMLYKIVPFLIWLHLNNLRSAGGEGLAKIPHMRQIISVRLTRWQYYLHIFALVIIMLAILWPEPWVRLGGAAVVLSGGLLAFNMFSAVRVYLRYAGAKGVTVKLYE